MSLCGKRLKPLLLIAYSSTLTPQNLEDTIVCIAWLLQAWRKAAPRRCQEPLSGIDSKRKGITRSNLQPEGRIHIALAVRVHSLGSGSQTSFPFNMAGLAIHPKGVQFDPDTDIPSLAGKIIFVTGGLSRLHHPVFRQHTSDYHRYRRHW
jgi:hypothetical protein